jgi:hypothetical protein
VTRSRPRRAKITRFGWERGDRRLKPLKRRIDAVLERINRWGLLRALYAEVMSRNRAWLTLCAVQTRLLMPDGLTVPIGHLDPQFSIRQATRDELIEAAAQGDLDLTWEFVEAALARGDRCTAAFVGPRLVAYTWRALSSAPHVHGLWVAFVKPDRYSYKAFTLPEFRGYHLQSHIAAAADPWFVARGFIRDISFIETHNYASIRSFRRIGHRFVGYAGYLTLFGRPIPFRSPGARKHGFRFYLPSPSH